MADVGRALSGVSKYFNKAGKISFYAASAVSLFDAINNLSKHDYGAAAKDGIDVAMGAVGFAGPIGFTISGLYFVVDQTIGWPNAIQSMIDFQKGKNLAVKMHAADWADFHAF